MTFEEYWGEDPDPGKITAKHAWNAAQQSERDKYAELIAAAEAVIARWETPLWKDFDEYWNDAGWHTDFEDDLREVWAAAQAAERERIKQIVRDVTEGRSNCNLLLERIAANEQRQDT